MPEIRKPEAQTRRTNEAALWPSSDRVAPKPFLHDLPRLADRERGGPTAHRVHDAWRAAVLASGGDHTRHHVIHRHHINLRLGFPHHRSQMPAPDQRRERTEPRG